MWYVRTKPRSITKLMDWAPNFLALEGQNWNYSKEIVDRKGNKKKIHPIRRNYIISSHLEEVNREYYSVRDFRSGKYDKKEKEAIARNDKATFEFFGMAYLDKKGFIKNTKYGDLVAKNKLSSEIFLRQMLKLQFPNAVSRKKLNFSSGEYVFPMEIVLNIFKREEFIELNRFEMGFMFCSKNSKDVTDIVLAIHSFREKYMKLKHKNIISEVRELFIEVLSDFFPECTIKPETLYGDYSDAFLRYLEYTALFVKSGRGYYAKLKLNELAEKKIQLLQDDFEFIPNEENDVEEFMISYGNPYSITLPWQRGETKKELIGDRVISLKKKIEIAKKTIDGFDEGLYKGFVDIDLHALSDEKLMRFEDELTDEYLNLNEYIFIKHTSTTNEERQKTIKKFDDILNGTEDDGALWLEVNTWKSLLGIVGEHKVNRNFNIEVDLSPRSFAPGKNNTPDMEVHSEEYIIVPEVSLTSGKTQWKNEGASVVEHVSEFIAKNPQKEVYGLFLSKKTDRRTAGMFLIHNKYGCFEDMVVPIIPLTIEQYNNILKTMYTYNLHIDLFKDLLKEMHEDAAKHNNHNKWLSTISSIIEKWLTIHKYAKKLAS